MGTRKRKGSVRTRNINPGAGGFAVTREKYQPVRRAMLAALPRSRQGMTFAQLVARLKPRLNRKLFPKRRSVDWYAKVVQLDLEKRGLIARIPGRVPQRLRRVK